MMKPWLELDLGRVPPAGPLAEAIRYALARWPALTRFLNDGRIELDNNTVERAIRGLGRWRRPMGNGLLPHRHRKAQQRRALCLAQRRPAAHDRRSFRQPPRRTLAVELATNKHQGLATCKEWTLTHKMLFAYERLLCRQKRPFDRLYRIQGDRQAVERSWKNGAGFFRRNLDHQISESPKPVLSDESARTLNGKPIVLPLADQHVAARERKLGAILLEAARMVKSP
jgi:Transposase IS66 family